VSSRARASSASRSGISAGSSAGTHQAMSNSSARRYAYSIAVVVLPTPPMPVTAWTTAGPPAPSAASNSANNPPRPVNSRTRAGIVHNRRETLGVGVGWIRGSTVSACSSAVSSSPGSETVIAVTLLSSRRARNACCRGPCSRSRNISAGP